ncbi:high frequency lysogenization protein HflD [Halothiobacillus sp. DCM-1]|uniref:high frequency lysogenization protein HflD n=1 Tax=Halothiobacillus sp. DCM-1 TaxID=3112558 RepID=UPI00325011F6
MAKHTVEDQTIALAALLQCARLVHQLAYQGQVENTTAMHTVIRSLFTFDPKDTADTYGQLLNLHLGFETLIKLLAGGQRSPNDAELIRYGVTLVNITQAFMADDRRSQQVFNRLTALKPSFEAHGLDDALMTDLDQLYREVISSLPTRMVINGEQRFLETPRIAHQIRSLLLAGLRATVLWRQVGGSRWALIFKRGQYLKAAKKLSIGHDI